MAALQKLADEFLTCIICQGVFKDPATLHCGHSFCETCITSYLLNQPEAQAETSISCPHCRGLTKVPDPQKPVTEWAGQLKTGFFIKGLVETFVTEENTKDIVLCSACKEGGEETPAEKWCTDCSEALCSKCLQLHTQYPKFREHKTSDLADGLKLKQSEEKHVCPEHKDEKLKLFCTDCDIAICQLCCSVGHRKCDSVVTLTKAYPTMKQDLTNKALDMQFAIVKSESVFSERKNQLSRLMESSYKAISDADTSCDAFIQILQAKRQKIKKKIIKQTDAAARLLTTDIESSERFCKQTEDNVATIQEANKFANEIELYYTYKMFCSKINPKPDTDHDEDEEAPRVIEINLKTDTDQITKSLHVICIGTLDCLYDKTNEVKEKSEGTAEEKGEPASPSVKSRPKHGQKDKMQGANLPRTSSVPGPDGKGNLSSKFTSEENLSRKGQGRKMPARSKAAKNEDAADGSPVLVDHIDVRAEIDKCEPHIEDILTVPDGDSVIIVLTDISNRKVKAVYRRNRQKSFVEFQQQPSGLTQVSDNEVAVAVKIAFRIYIIRLRPQLQIISHIDTKEGYTHICQLDGNRLAASSGGNAIDILDQKGTLTKRIQNEHLTRTILYKSNMPGQVLVCDPDSHSVTRLSTNNKVSFRFEPFGKHRLVNNFGAGIDHKGNIYVVNRGCNNVVMINGQGKFVKNVLSMDAKVEKLAYIAFDKTNKMYLTYEDKSVCIYQL